MRMLLQIMTESATQAAVLIPLLYIAQATPAHAQLPRATPATASMPTPIQPTHSTGLMSTEPLSTEPLALVSRHMNVHIAGARAQVHTQLVYRNDTATAVQASHLLADGARLLTADDSGNCTDIDDGDAQFVESGEAPPHSTSVNLEVAPGEEITIETRRDATVFVRGTRHQLVLPVARDDRALFTPAFSAWIEVFGDTPVTNLGSATHGGDVTGIGKHVAQLDIANGRAFARPFLAVEFELSQPNVAFAAASDEPMFQINARTRR